MSSNLKPGGDSVSDCENGNTNIQSDSASSESSHKLLLG
jgi:hypothetical protein